MLYIIDQNKRIKELEKDNKEFQKVINKLLDNN